ncbi:styrene monooxygenase/indole monooxygenase family protein [Fodinicola acaciae]|uniref:styrene monooxygenase/indole monooxygenase family protein n=1 Tax=Fodinicola acaciae TaxID=2681555 RepID=UPI0013D6DB66|nr:styrene monooxygenase/indole monooxygenase family protein [Fodinicola acaciae]
MRRVLIVGAGQCGLQLGLSLLAEGYDVTVMSARTPEEIRGGWPTSTQCMFNLALQSERDYGLNLWEDRVPHVAGLHIALSAPPGQKALDVIGPLDHHGESTDQRLKMAAWLELIEQRGGTVIYQGVTTADLDGLTALGRYDLTIVAAGRGELGALFDRNPSRSPFVSPQRGLAVAYVHGLAPDPMFPQPSVGFNAIPGGFGELFVIPALTLSGPCDILFWEVIPDGPLDLWKERLDPAEHLKRTLELIREYLPWVYERCANVELTDARATLSGRFTPTVRHPVGDLPSGGMVLGAADVVVANDPITGQGSNMAAKCAHAYLQAILAHGDAPFDREWMEETFEKFWIETAVHTTMWTNGMLQPLPEHVQQLLGAASQDQRIARRLANGFSDPTDFQHWFATPEAAKAYLGSLAE